MTEVQIKTISIDGLIIGNAEPSLQTATITTASVCRVRLEWSTVIHPGQERFLSASIKGTSNSPLMELWRLFQSLSVAQAWQWLLLEFLKGKHRSLSVSQMSGIVQLKSGGASQLLNCHRLYLC